jgi:hypothetical protein
MSPAQAVTSAQPASAGIQYGNISYIIASYRKRA